jgi:hypothetical protein
LEAKINKNWLNKFQKLALKYEVDPQTIDWQSLDWQLDYWELKNNVMEKIKELSKKDISTEVPKDLIEYYEKTASEIEQNYLKQQLEEQIKKIKSSEQTEIIDEKFYTLTNLIKTLAKSENIHSLIVESETGLGKSYTTIRTLAREGIPFEVISGHITPLELYNFLYINQNKIIVIDDNGTVLKDDRSKTILLNALWSPLENRTVNYYSSTEKLKAPEQFEFSGKIIFLTNKLPEELSNLKSRCYYYHFSLNFQDKLLLLYEIAKINKIPVEIVDFIKENCNEAYNIDLRTVIKLWDLYRFSSDWKRLALDILELNETAFLVREMLKKYTTEQASKEFVKSTGLSRRTFFRIKKRLNL